MIITCSRNGFLAAWRHPGLAAILWAWSLVVALPFTISAWSWWREATALAPETDQLLTRFHFGVMSDLARANPSLGLLMPVLLGSALVACVGQALASGGTIEVLSSADARPFMHRFLRGAGHFFWRFLRAGIYGTIVFLVLAAIVWAIWTPLGRALEDVNWEPAWYLGSVARLLALGFLAVIVLLAVDYARIRMARDDSRAALRAFFGSLWFVARHPKATVGVWLVMAVATVVLAAAYLLFRAYVPSDTAGLILLMLVAQQLTVAGRAWLRVATVGGEMGVWEKYNPVVSSLESRVPSSDAAPMAESAVSPPTGVSESDSA